MELRLLINQVWITSGRTVTATRPSRIKVAECFMIQLGTVTRVIGML